MVASGAEKVERAGEGLFGSLIISLYTAAAPGTTGKRCCASPYFMVPVSCTSAAEALHEECFSATENIPPPLHAGQGVHSMLPIDTLPVDVLW